MVALMASWFRVVSLLILLITPTAFAEGNAELVEKLAAAGYDLAIKYSQGLSGDPLNLLMRQKQDAIANPVVKDLAKMSKEGIDDIVRLIYVGQRKGTPVGAINGIKTLSKNFKARYVAQAVKVSVIQAFFSKLTPQFLSGLASVANKTAVLRKTAALTDDAIRAAAEIASKEFDEAVELAGKGIIQKVSTTTSGKSIPTLVQGASRSSLSRTGMSLGGMARGGSFLVKYGIFSGAGVIADVLLSSKTASAAEIYYPGDSECMDQLARKVSGMVGYLNNTFLQIEALQAIRSCYSPVPPIVTLEDLFNTTNPDANHSQKLICSPAQMSALRELADDYGGAAQTHSYSFPSPGGGYGECIGFNLDPADSEGSLSDVNMDGIVDAADFGVAFGMSEMADINFDGLVDAADFGIMMGAFGKTNLLYPAEHNPVSTNTLEGVVSKLEDPNRWKGCNLSEFMCYPEATNNTSFDAYLWPLVWDIAEFE